MATYYVIVLEVTVFALRAGGIGDENGCRVWKCGRARCSLRQDVREASSGDSSTGRASEAGDVDDTARTTAGILTAQYPRTRNVITVKISVQLAEVQLQLFGLVCCKISARLAEVQLQLFVQSPKLGVKRLHSVQFTGSLRNLGTTTRLLSSY
ncbi:hypothetical protein B0H10DRAFT_1966259 [Mycena sp. CBHHK59/15]|nr:hypothetical protein B0H10DRAFT_1966259 [Mycena sp. CBHHK59/15]